MIPPSPSITGEKGFLSWIEARVDVIALRIVSELAERRQSSVLLFDTPSHSGTKEANVSQVSSRSEALTSLWLAAEPDWNICEDRELQRRLGKVKVSYGSAGEVKCFIEKELRNYDRSCTFAEDSYLKMVIIHS